MSDYFTFEDSLIKAGDYVSLEVIGYERRLTVKGSPFLVFSFRAKSSAGYEMEIKDVFFSKSKEKMQSLVNAVGLGGLMQECTIDLSQLLNKKCFALLAEQEGSNGKNYLCVESFLAHDDTSELVKLFDRNHNPLNVAKSGFKSGDDDLDNDIPF